MFLGSRIVLTNPVHLDVKRPYRTVEELHHVAATRAERRPYVKVDRLAVYCVYCRATLPSAMRQERRRRKLSVEREMAQPRQSLQSYRPERPRQHASTRRAALSLLY